MMKYPGYFNVWLAIAALAAMAAPALGAEAVYVRRSPRDGRYFELSDGRPYLPIGFDLVNAPRADELESVLDTMAANKVNYCRVWLDGEPWKIEREAAGVYDAERAKVLRHFLDMAGERGVRVKPCVEYFRDVQPARKKWTDNPAQHRANGGPFVSMDDYLYSAEGQARFRRKLEFYRGQIGDHPAVFAWELWNEMNAVRADWVKWTAIMLPELHRLFPQNMAVQSLGSFDRDGARAGYRILCAMEKNDVAQVHRYLDLGAELEICHGPVDVLAADAVRELLAMNPGKPVLLAECGAVKPKHTGCSELYARDKDGTILHDIIFAPFFAGAAGTGNTWWWAECVQKANQWRQFARFARAVEGIDPAAEGFQPVTIEHPRLRVYLLQGRRVLLGWCRDKKNDWRSELERGQAPERLEGLTLDLRAHLTGKKPAAARGYSPWTDQWSELEMKDGVAALPAFERSLVVKVELGS